MVNYLRRSCQQHRHHYRPRRRSFAHCMLHQAEYTIDEIDANMVYESFRRTKDSVGAMDRWHPRELAFLSKRTCSHLATMLSQIEQGAPWPVSTTNARAVYREKNGANIGEVMSDRPRTITAPSYRAWATMRLRMNGRMDPHVGSSRNACWCSGDGCGRRLPQSSHRH